MELTPVSPVVDSPAVLESLVVVSFVTRAILPNLLSLAVLHVVVPISFVATAIFMDVNSKTLSLVLTELSDVDITSAVPEGALTMSLVVVPHALVDGSVDPFADSISLPQQLNILLSNFVAGVLNLQDLSLVLAFWILNKVMVYEFGILGHFEAETFEVLVESIHPIDIVFDWNLKNVIFVFQF